MAKQVFRMSRYATNEVIGPLRPFDPDNPRSLGINKLLVFSEGGQVIVSVQTTRGSLNVPLTRRQATQLADRIDDQLDSMPEQVIARRRLKSRR
jgi:hypothetical protein